MAQRSFPFASWATALLLLATALPIISIFVLALGGDTAAWPRLISTVLPPLLLTTLLLSAGCAILTLLIGGTSAWLVAMYDFPGRSTLKWMALLPLAIPGYIISFLYVDALTFAGPLQGWLRSAFGWSRPGDYWFPEVRSVWGAIVVLSFALSPYVYLAGWAAFVKQPMNQLYVARTLGRSPFRAFLEVSLPQARPALLIGVFLVVTECLNDIGAATFFGVRTLTIAVYGTWLDEGNLAGAAQLAMLLLAGMATLLLFEHRARQQDQLARNAIGGATAQRQQLKGARGFFAAAAVLLPVLIGFAIPVLLLLQHGMRRLDELVTSEFLRSLTNSVLLAVMCCLATLLIALTLAYANRAYPSARRSAATRFAGLGYALPGTVLGIGVLVPFGQFDQALDAFAQNRLGVHTGLVLSGGIFALLFAYVTRFLIIATGNIDAGMAKIPEHIDNVARTLGSTSLQSFTRIHIPLLRPSIVAACLLVFVDAMKELPVTLMLRPFDFETLATRVFSLSSLGQFESAALPALAIVAAGLLPVAILSRSLRDAGRHQSAAG